MSREDIKLAFFDIADDKSPGPDGYSAAFYKAIWQVIGDEVTRTVMEFFINGLLLKQINATLLVLIPKRIREVLDRLISPSHNAFVRSRKIGDNILLAQELFAGYNPLNLPKRCALKVDLRKAYDMVECDFLFAAMRLFGFRNHSLGLYVNPGKSHPILSNVAHVQRRRLLEVLGFQEGHLSVQYLGLPLISSRLTLADCRPILMKIDGRIRGWGGLSLSFAARVKLIKSVLMTMNVYWAMAFILPKGIIRKIKKRLWAFLWKGVSNVGYPKVAWSQVCKPVTEGGMGVREIRALNLAMMSRRLWDVVTRNRASFWVQWIYHFRLHDKTVWTKSANTGSWGWRKMIRLRDASLSHVLYYIGDGGTLSLWQDPWHQLGPLIF
ncbi:UNVERIFIED_CONTAM: hypothetical protein Slati_0043100 [Sesamum latifolium]|uniref:Reverse transcriptase domain-containing protein n=1 Tax=Sesamum latifolium TaxID=2727402 RepID=A0AAW2Y709_9LAMI